MNENNKGLYIPAAILLAGFLVATAIYFTEKKNAPVAEVQQPVQIAGLPFKPIDATDHILGNPNAPVTILEYSDTECPFCKSFDVTMKSIMNTYGKDGKVDWVYRHFPLDSIHPKTRKEAEATECANELAGNKGFWDMLDKIYTNTPSNNGLDASLLPVFAKAVGLDQTKFNTCLASGKYAATVEADFQDGIKAGAQGTPYSVMILANPLTSTQETTITNFIAQSGLASNMTITNDKKEVILNGALPLQYITPVIDAVIK
jgi:protein-disulfide isomerase